MPIDPVFSLYFFSFTTFLLTTPPRPACHRIICTNLCLKIAPIDTINNYNPSQFDSNEYSTGCICCHDRLVQFGGKGGGGRGMGEGVDVGWPMVWDLGWLSVRHCLISFVWTGTMLDEQKVFDRAPPVILPILHANVYQNPTTEQ